MGFCKIDENNCIFLALPQKVGTLCKHRSPVEVLRHHYVNVHCPAQAHCASIHTGCAPSLSTVQRRHIVQASTQVVRHHCPLSSAGTLCKHPHRLCAITVHCPAHAHCSSIHTGCAPSLSTVQRRHIVQASTQVVRHHCPLSSARTLFKHPHRLCAITVHCPAQAHCASIHTGCAPSLSTVQRTLIVQASTQVVRHHCLLSSARTHL